MKTVKQSHFNVQFCVRQNKQNRNILKMLIYYLLLVTAKVSSFISLTIHVFKMYFTDFFKAYSWGSIFHFTVLSCLYMSINYDSDPIIFFIPNFAMLFYPLFFSLSLLGLQSSVKPHLKLQSSLKPHFKFLVFYIAPFQMS